jgi:hypothetical protein
MLQRSLPRPEIPDSVEPDRGRRPHHSRTPTTRLSARHREEDRLETATTSASEFIYLALDLEDLQ